MEKPTMNDLLKKIEALEKEVAELKAIAHPQHVMADPALTEAIKRLAERCDGPLPLQSPQCVPDPFDWREHFNPQPGYLSPRTIC